MKIHILIVFQVLITFVNSYSQNVWERTIGLNNISIVSLAVTSDGTILAGTDTNSTCSIYRSTDDGTTWSNIGYHYLKITGFVIKSNQEILISSLDHHLGGGVLHSTDDGISWSSLGFTNASTAIAINSFEDIFIGTINNYVFRSTDNGINWEQINQGLTSPYPTSITLTSNDTVFVGTVNSGVFRSIDNGNNWVLTNAGITNNQILSLATNSNGDIFAGTEGSGIFRSNDNGNNWVEINSGLTYTEGYRVRSISINSNDDIYIGTADGVFRSTNNGDTWTQINDGLTNHDVYSLAFNSSGYVFVGTADGVFRSISPLPIELSSFNLKLFNDEIQLNWVTKTEVNDYGFNIERRINLGEWNTIGFVEGSGNSNSPKEYSYADKDLFAGGSKFQYRLKQIDTDGSFEYSNVVDMEVMPTQFELSQNYPNPFNPSTTIRFSLPEATQMKITIYNMLGEQVATIAEGMYESGYYKVTFNASNLPSGTYIYRIVSDGFVQTKKMMLLK